MGLRDLIFTSVTHCGTEERKGSENLFTATTDLRAYMRGIACSQVRNGRRGVTLLKETEEKVELMFYNFLWKLCGHWGEIPCTY